MNDIGSTTSPDIPVYEHDEYGLEITLELIDEYREELAHRLEEQGHPAIAQEVLKWTDEETLEVGTLSHWFYSEPMRELIAGHTQEEGSK